MRKSARILFIVALAVVLCCMLAACSDNTGAQYTPPTTIGGNAGDGGGAEVDNLENNENAIPVYLSFTYLTQSPSVFKHIYIDEFSLSNIEYHITYNVTKLDEYGEEYTELEAGKGTPLTIDMLDSESKTLITKAGHHMINVSYTTPDGDELEGSFVVHLKDRVNTEMCTLTFNLAGGSALFGSVSGEAVTTEVVKGSTYTYSDFISNFRVIRYDDMNTPNDATDDEKFALSGWTGFIEDEDKDYMTIDSDKTFTAKWTKNVVSVKFDLNIPSDATEAPTAPAEQTVEKYNGIVARPSVDSFAILTGYTFSGWYTSKTGGSAWNFSNRIGNEGFTLYARWTVRTYSVTYILMGGNIDITKALSEGDYTVADATASYYNGYREGEEGYDPNYSQNYYTDLPFRVTFSGLSYGSSLDAYKAEVLSTAVSTSATTVGVGPDAFASQLIKGDNYYTFAGWYTSSSYLDTEKYTDAAITSNLVLFAKWDLSQNLDADKTAAYYDYLYSYTVKADGTLRIDLVKDTSVSTLVIPQSIRVDGVDYAVTEFGEKAGLNLKTLVAIDASKATNLTTVGKQAFASDLALRTVIQPEGGSGITEVGEDAFKATQWLNDLSATSDTSFAVIGNVIVKYVGDPEVVTLQIDKDVYPELEGAITIASGALKGYPLLETVTIGDEIVNIKDNAFYNCISLKTVTAGEGLENVGSSAFLNTPYVSSAPTDDPATTIDESTYLQLGGIFYRYIAKTGNTAVIPDETTIIAPDAFAGANWVEYINFEDVTKIVKIGEGAFSDTVWITRTQSYAGNPGTYIDSNGFVVINNILISYTGRATTVTLPDDIKVIASRAFSGLSNGKVTNVIIPAGELERIEDEAFYGAVSLRAVSFTDTTNNALVKITPYTFSGRTGELVNRNLKIYLYKTPLNTVKSNIGESDPYLAWKELGASYSSIFVELITASARLNSSVVPNKYLYDGNAVNFEQVWRSAGLLTDDVAPKLASGVIVTRNDGITIIEDILVSQITGSGEIGLRQKFSFKVAGGVDGADVSGVDYTYNIYAAINEESLSVELPTFYSTQGVMPTDGINISYTLNDGNNTPGTMPISDPMVTVDGYKATVGTRALSIIINYYGLAVYDQLSSVQYTVRKPANVTIEQNGSFAIPVNAEARNYYSGVQMLVTMDDGKETTAFLSDTSKVTVISASDAEAKNANAESITLDTSTLGYHTDAGIRYGTRKEGFIYCKLLYSVILSTDASMFTYEITANVAGGAEQTPVREAVVTGIKSGYEATVAIPSKVRLDATNATVATGSNGEVFSIVGVADDAFLNKTELEYAYIPASVTELGARAFKGCIALKQVYSFSVQDEGASPVINMDHVTVLSEDVISEASITISGLNDTAIAEIVVPEMYIYTLEQSGTGTDNCDRTVTFNSTVILTATAFSSFTGRIYLPNTPTFIAYASENLAGKSVYFYSGDEKTATAARYFVINNYSTPDVTSEVITGEVCIDNNVNINATSGVIVIPGTISTSNENITATYAVSALAEAAFSRIYANGCRSLYLPNSLRSVGGSESTRFGGHADEITMYVYDVSETYIYAPSTKFSSYVKNIGSSCFYGCSSLLDVDFSAATALEEIGSYAFYDCDAIVELDFSKSKIEEIEASAFAECSNLVTARFRDTLKTIGDYAFGNCSKLEYAGDGFNLTYIGAYAFHNCRALTLFTQPASLTSNNIGQSAFDGCVSLSTVWILNKETAGSITLDNTGNVIAKAQIIFIISDATYSTDFADNFTKYEGGSANTPATVNGAPVTFRNAAVNWNSDGNTITVYEDGKPYTLSVYVAKQ